MPTLTEEITRTLTQAQAQAASQGAKFVQAEHVFAALLNAEKETLKNIFAELQVPLADFQKTYLEKAGFKPAIASSTPVQLEYDVYLKTLTTRAEEEAHQLDSATVKPEHLFLAFSREEKGPVAETFKQYQITPAKITAALQNLITATGGSLTPYLDKYGQDLTLKARTGKLDQVLDRHAEIERVIQILCRRRKNNPVLYGGPGVGKTAIVEGLAQMIAAGQTPESLKNKRIIELNIFSILAGAARRGEYEERLKHILNEVKNAAGEIILFIDEIHTLVSEEDSDEAANILKPALARGELQAIGATTIQEYRKYFEKDAALERRFQPVFVDEPSEEECFVILKGLKEKYEQYHQITLTDDILEEAIKLSKRYITNRLLPDKALDLIDEAASSIRIPSLALPGEIDTLEQIIASLKPQLAQAQKDVNEPLTHRLARQIATHEKRIVEIKTELQAVQSQPKNVLTKFTLQKIVSQATGIPLDHLREEESERLLNIEASLSAYLVGQDHAVKAVSDAILRNRAGLKKVDRPIGSFIFMGSSGVGKTELAERLAEYLFGTKDALLRFDMSEFMEKHSSARLIGAPPGYIGFEEGGQLTEAVRTRPYSIILFDEIEKAHADVFNLLLQILDEGRLTDSKGQVVNFKNVIVICTSNLGGSTIDFAELKSLPEKEHKKRLVDELKKHLRPELINRFDEIVFFNFLTQEDILKIVDIVMKDTQTALEEKDISLTLNDAAKQKLAELGFDPVLGARPLKYTIQRELENPLSRAILKGEFKAGDQLAVDHDGEKFTFRKLNAPAAADPPTESAAESSTAPENPAT